MKEMQEWFHSKQWGELVDIQAHASINLIEFYEQYHAHPDWWQKVFDFLKQDLKSLEVGKYPLVGDRVFAMVSEYETKSPQDAKWEAHRKYIDLQYVVAGQEVIGVLPLGKTIDPKDYNEQKDLIFFGEQDGEFFTATPDCFFLFFPDDVHRPCMMIEQSEPVKKLVIKIAVAE
ncbi:YhcH/YjgK/YiaL family protein [Sunxiuqinia indica]|uniref:YhcH/YjgK/YiaL family protein n=1 Tax=Sunxiuqinia indica TaxID=2692584 RepID=UPI00135BE5FD|nr:YhcH/YjgK/YiaL family protein [Sunxiuqinia indica]